MSVRRSAKRAVAAYIIGTYPRLTTTFIDREIKALNQRGTALHILSIRHPTPYEEAQLAPEIAPHTQYLLPTKGLEVLAAVVTWAISRPRTFFALLGYLVTRPHPSLRTRVKTVLHFGEGVLAATRLADKHIAHIHAHFADRAAIVALVAARLLRITYSLFAHANDIYVSPVLLPEKLCQASFVATCTRHNQMYLTTVAQGHLPRPIELIYHGLQLEQFIPLTPRPTLPRRLLSVGQLREKKGHAYLIHACHKLRQRGYDFTCHIIGDGPERDALRALIDQFQLDGVVNLHGALPHQEVLAHYRRATVFALASVTASNADRDGLPNVFLEAMAMGLPVIGTQISGIPELIQDGVNGLLIPCRDVDALADAIARVWDNAAFAEQLAVHGRLTVERHFDIERNIVRLVDLLENFLTGQADLGTQLSQPVGEAL